MKRIALFLLLALPFHAFAGSGVLKEDTATQVAIGPFLDGSDGVTAETALTVTEWDCDLVKHADSGMSATALTITASAGSNDAAHLQSGIYSLELTATDTNTAGRLVLICDHGTPTTFMPVRHEWMVVPTQEYDSFYGTDVQQVHVVEYTAGVIDSTAVGTLTGGDIGVGAFASGAITADAIATDAIGAAEIAAAAITSAEIGTLTGGDIGVGAFASASITADAIATDAIGAAEIAASAIGASEIATDAIGAAEIAADAVGAAEAGFLTDSTGFAGANIDAAITSRLAPTTAARTLDINATGEVAIDLDATVGTLSDAEVANDALGAAPPTNWNALVISGGGAADTLVQGFVDNAFGAEAAAGSIVANFEVFHDLSPTSAQTQDDVGAAGAGLNVTTGTAQTATHTTTALVLASGQVSHDNNYKWNTLTITNGDCGEQSRTIISSTASTDTVTVAPAFDESGTCSIDVDFDGATYEIAPAGTTFVPLAAVDTVGGLSTEDASGHIPVDVIEVGGTAQTALNINDILTDTADMQPKLGTPAVDISADIATVDSNVDAVLADTGTDGVVLANDAVTAAKIAADAIGASEIAANAIGAAEIATDAIGADELATGGIDEILERIGMFRAAISVVDSTTQLDLDNGPATADALNDEWSIIIFDNSDNDEPVCHRRVTDWIVTTQQVVYDSACDVTVTTSDTVLLMPTGVGTVVTLSGGSSTLDTDSNGRVRVVDGTGAGEIDTDSGTVLLRSATETQIDAIETDTNSLNDTKVPDTISLANINAEVDTALDTAIPGVPTANSINERIAAIDDLTQSAGAGDLAAILTDTNSLNDTKVPQTLNLTASGNIGVDWANVENPTTAVDLSATDIQLADTVTSATTLETRIPSGCGANTGIPFTVQTDAGNSGTQVKTDLTDADFGDDQFGGTSIPKRGVYFTSGNAEGLGSTIQSFTTSTDILTFDSIGLTPADGVTGCIQ